MPDLRRLRTASLLPGAVAAFAVGLNEGKIGPEKIFKKTLDGPANDPHNSPPSLIAANENEAIKTNCSLKIYSR
ncbi:hypothetical protein PWP93_19375 [Paraburkholderia sp. A1RI-2L]|uniref:hypothetical protein n=1 Tax=Paraburkholderia sp. A1RI-2L TaxID=3028367 RepID=UPI003B7A11E0